MKIGNYPEQGDVIIKKIDHIPNGAKKENNLILAHGENGHCHQILERQKAQLFKNDNFLYLKVDAPVGLIHEEHKTITLLPGNYEIDKVKEYDPFEEEIRRVQD